MPNNEKNENKRKGVFIEGGDNVFKDYKFSRGNWSAPYIYHPDDLKNVVSSLNLPGRMVVNMVAIGMGYDMREDDIENCAYKQQSHLEEEERHYLSKFENINERILIRRSAEVDEPIIIEFDDGDRIEVLFDWYSQVRLSMNCIPLNIKPGVNRKTFDASVLFSTIIGKKIESVEIMATDINDSDYYNEAIDEQDLFIDSFLFRFEDGSVLKFWAWYDYGIIELLDKEGGPQMIPFGELKNGLFLLDEEIEENDFC